MQLIVEKPNSGEFSWTITVRENRDDLDLANAIDTALQASPGGVVQLWIRDVDSEADALATDLGFSHHRDLWQLRCALPNAASQLCTRALTEADLDDFVRVNNRAFHWHPEQSGLTVEAARATMTEDWFDPNGFRLLHHDSTGELIGFCWTKIHAASTPPLGEIYVIAIDPDHHGQGLGKPMTLAGLEWLSERGLEHGMLYVESDNDPANATYSALGFTRHHIDRAYRLDR